MVAVATRGWSAGPNRKCSTPRALDHNPSWSSADRQRLGGHDLLSVGLIVNTRIVPQQVEFGGGLATMPSRSFKQKKEMQPAVLL